MGPRYRASNLPGDICLNLELVLGAKIGVEIIRPDDGPVCLAHQPGNEAQPAPVHLDIALERVVGSRGMITRRRFGDHDQVIELSKLANNIVPQAAGDIRTGIEEAALGKNLDGDRRRKDPRRRRPDRSAASYSKKGKGKGEERKNKDGQQTGPAAASGRQSQALRLPWRIGLIRESCDLHIAVFLRPCRRRRVPEIFEMRHVAAFRHRDDDLVRLACDKIITLQCLSDAAGLDPDDRIVLRVERCFPTKHHICDGERLQEACSTCKRLVDDKSQEISPALRRVKFFTCKNSLNLPADFLSGRSRTADYIDLCCVSHARPYDKITQLCKHLLKHHISRA
ncbi:UNVERIFIED_ORG: hypothetical protein GGD51_004686 [Rhizobium esperanzae]